MNIQELAKAGIATATHPDLPEHARITFYIADREKGLVGPWATVKDAATDAGVLEPQKAPSWQLPETGWKPYETTKQRSR